MHIFPVDARVPGATLDMAAEVLHRDQVLAWFPEEWRSPDGELQPFRPGIGALIDRTRVPVVPCYIVGPFEAMPRTARVPKPARMAVRFGPPIEAEELLPDEDPKSESERHRAIARNLQTAVKALEKRARRDREG
jgi:long-chain acyl-CoA synthetase